MLLLLDCLVVSDILKLLRFCQIKNSHCHLFDHLCSAWAYKLLTILIEQPHQDTKYRDVVTVWHQFAPSVWLVLPPHNKKVWGLSVWSLFSLRTCGCSLGTPTSSYSPKHACWVSTWLKIFSVNAWGFVSALWLRGTQSRVNPASHQLTINEPFN